MKDVGFVSSNPNNVKVLELLRKRSSVSVDEIAKFTRIPKVTLRTIMDELKRRGFIVEEEGYYSISKEGLEVLKRL